MNKTLKVLPFILAVVIVMLGVSIPVLAMNDGKKTKQQTVNQAAVSSASEETQTVDIKTVADAETTVTAVAEEKQDATSGKAMAAAIVVGIAAAAGAIGMGMAISKSVEGISRQPEAAGNIRTSLMLGLVFIETAIIYALIVAILIIFVM